MNLAAESCSETGSDAVFQPERSRPLSMEKRNGVAGSKREFCLLRVEQHAVIGGNTRTAQRVVSWRRCTLSWCSLIHLHFHPVLSRCDYFSHHSGSFSCNSSSLLHTLPFLLFSCCFQQSLSTVSCECPRNLHAPRANHPPWLRARRDISFFSIASPASAHLLLAFNNHPALRNTVIFFASGDVWLWNRLRWIWRWPTAAAAAAEFHLRFLRVRRKFGHYK